MNTINKSLKLARTPTSALMNSVTVFMICTVINSVGIAQAQSEKNEERVKRVTYGHERGNGGDVLVCKQTDGNSKVTFYDLYEAEEIHGKRLSIPNGKTLDEKMAELFKRVEKTDHFRAQVYRKWYKEFFHDLTPLRGKVLADIPDIGISNWPKNCHPEQLITQAEPRPPIRLKRFTRNEDLWDQLDLNSRAATITHEFFLRETHINGEPNSESARYANALLWADEFHVADLKEYIERNESLGLALYTGRVGFHGWNPFAVPASQDLFDKHFAGVDVVIKTVVAEPLGWVGRQKEYTSSGHFILKEAPSIPQSVNLNLPRMVRIDLPRGKDKSVTTYRICSGMYLYNGKKREHVFENEKFQIANSDLFVNELITVDFVNWVGQMYVKRYTSLAINIGEHGAHKFKMTQETVNGGPFHKFNIFEIYDWGYRLGKTSKGEDLLFVDWAISGNDSLIDFQAYRQSYAKTETVGAIVCKKNKKITFNIFLRKDESLNDVETRIHQVASCTLAEQAKLRAYKPGTQQTELVEVPAGKTVYLNKDSILERIE